jgi:lipid A 3-O-deacylase
MPRSCSVAIGQCPYAPRAICPLEKELRSFPGLVLLSAPKEFDSIMTKKPGWWFSMSLAVIYATAAHAQEGRQNDFSDQFQRGTCELTVASGVMFSPIGADKGRHTVDYSLSGLQCGWMLTDVNRSGWLRGNVELAGEAIGGAVFKGRGSYLAGGTAWLRYNFVQPNWRVVPYLQAGAGAEGTDMDQRLIGEKFNFNLDIAAGLRCFVARDWSLNVECRYQHISNGTIAKHDVGINAVGPMIGLSYFF